MKYSDFKNNPSILDDDNIFLKKKTKRDKIESIEEEKKSKKIKEHSNNDEGKPYKLDNLKGFENKNKKLLCKNPFLEKEKIENKEYVNNKKEKYFSLEEEEKIKKVRKKNI